MSFSDRPLSVCFAVCLSVNFYIFGFFSRTTGSILTRLGTNHPWLEGIQVSTNEGDKTSPRGDNSERVKIHLNFLKIFSSKTSIQNSIKLGTNYPWMKGNQVCSNKGPAPLQRGDKHKNVKIGCDHLKIFSRTTGPILTRLGTNHLWVEGIQHCNEGDNPSPRGDNSERVKIRAGTIQPVADPIRITIP
jgi:hypothetical protein